MGNEIYIVKRGNTRVTLPDKASATNIVIALTILGCCDPLTTQMIAGNKQDLEVFELTFLDKHVNIVSQHDAETVLHWMLELGCTKACIEKISEASKEKD